MPKIVSMSNYMSSRKKDHSYLESCGLDSEVLKPIKVAEFLKVCKEIGYDYKKASSVALAS